MNPATPVEKNLDCPVCAEKLPHTLTACSSGCEFLCSRCGGSTAAFTFDQMRSMLANVARHVVPSTPFDASSMPTPRVTVAKGSLEIEMAPPFVRRHMEITGGLPLAGEPFYTSFPGVPASVIRIPYGTILAVLPGE